LIYALILETLELVLILILMIVRIGTAFTKNVSRGISWWLDEGMPRILDLEHKEDWTGAEKKGDN
jgi:hypothetical protein